MLTFDDLRLDDPDALATLDASGVLVELASSGARLRAGVTLAEEALARRDDLAGRPRCLVVVADPSAWTAADALVAVAGPACPVPIVRAGGPLPPWVGAADLVLVLSGTGTGRATLASAVAARRRGTLLVVAAPPESPLAAAVGGPGTVHLPTGSVGGGLASLWGPLGAAALALARSGLLDAAGADLAAAADALDTESVACRPASESFVNPGKTLAVELADTLPVIWPASPLAEVAARRAARRLAQCAGVAASVAPAQEALAATSRVLAGPLAPDRTDIFADPLDVAPPVRHRVVLLREAGEDAEQRWAADSLAAEAAAAGAATSEVAADLGEPFTRLATLIARLDFAATYLAVGYGLDPAARPVVDLVPGSPAG